MKIKIALITVFGFFIATACQTLSPTPVESLPNQESSQNTHLTEKANRNVLLLVGEGGTSGSLFKKAAETRQKTTGGSLVHVHNGDEFIKTINAHVSKNGSIDHLEYFGHGNHVALFVNQSPTVNGAMYANDPEVHKEYLSASIYELPKNIFTSGAQIKLNGCNVANGFPEKNTLAQNIANYFNVEVVAPLGPTEFASNEEGEEMAEEKDEVYMIPTYSEKNFVTVKPQQASNHFTDVFIGQNDYEAILNLSQRGLALSSEHGQFQPYKNISESEAVEFCKVALGLTEKCDLGKKIEDKWIRNLNALKLLMDGYEINFKQTTPWRDGYIYWAAQQGLLTEEFTNKSGTPEGKWQFSRGIS
ncbi:hypothetical protein IPJ72_01735 [Candidatus Peregrinibacteria bacterium]|nr:MAG: hypothetical protein IPJ72_01735 [Candidatus Peregrinibacteria bacterium]